jgi:hypothetical protein
MKTCQSHILKEYKTKKADCMWPESNYGPTDVGTLPVCGGSIKAELEVDHEGGYGWCNVRPTIKLTCSKCQHPYIPGVLKFNFEAKQVIDELLEKYL